MPVKQEVIIQSEGRPDGATRFSYTKPAFLGGETVIVETDLAKEELRDVIWLTREGSPAETYEGLLDSIDPYTEEGVGTKIEKTRVMQSPQGLHLISKDSLIIHLNYLDRALRCLQQFNDHQLRKIFSTCSVLECREVFLDFGLEIERVLDKHNWYVEIDGMDKDGDAVLDELMQIMSPIPH